MVETITQQTKHSRLYGVLIGIGVFLIICVVLWFIKITPYSVYTGGGISVNYPNNWKVLERLQNVPGLLVSFVAPPQSAMDTSAENVNITYQDLAKPMTLAQFSQLAVHQLTGTFREEVKVLESESTQLAGRPAYRFTYVSVVPEAPFKITHIMTLEGNRGYIFTYFAMERDYDVFYGQVKGMIDSFKIL